MVSSNGNVLLEDNDLNKPENAVSLVQICSTKTSTTMEQGPFVMDPVNVVHFQLLG